MSGISFSRHISAMAAEKGEQIALTCEDEAFTWRELDRYTNRLARAYASFGVKQDDFVTIALPNSNEFVLACVALWKLGATPQPVSNALPAAELRAIVALAKPPLVIGGEQAMLPDMTVVPVGFKADAGLSDAPLPDAVAKHWKAPTSGGSTGRPKLIVSCQPSIIDPDRVSLLRLPYDGHVLVPGPLYHNGPLIVALDGLLQGNQVIIMKRFDAEETLKLIEAYQISWIMLVPTMMQRIWKLPDEVKARYDISSLKTLVHVASVCPAWLKEEWINWLGPEAIHELYCGTEGQGGTWITGTQWLKKKGSVGKAMEWCQLKICDEAGREVPRGQTGDVYFLPNTGQGSTYHYVGATPTAIDGGFETLGDIGYVDEDGYLFLCDRKKDLIISGGANIYPAEVEAAIDAHPLVKSCAVIGLPHEDMGQLVHAVVEAEGLTKEALYEHLSQLLVRYKIPRTFDFVSHPVRDEAGKVRRSALAETRALG